MSFKFNFKTVKDATNQRNIFLKNVILRTTSDDKKKKMNEYF